MLGKNCSQKGQEVLKLFYQLENLWDSKHCMYLTRVAGYIVIIIPNQLNCAGIKMETPNGNWNWPLNLSWKIQEMSRSAICIKRSAICIKRDMVANANVCIYPAPPLWTGCDTRPIF